MKGKWDVWSIYFSCLSQTLALTTIHMDQMCGSSIPGHDRYRQVSFKFDSSNISHRDCTVTVNPGALYLGDRLWIHGEKGFLFVFQEVNLFNTKCRHANISVAKPGLPSYYYDLDYFEFERPDRSIPGIPEPICQHNIPWSTYPSPVIKSEYLQIRFQGDEQTPDNTGFKLLIADYYDGVECFDEEYQCNNDRCIAKSAHNCDGIDWCGDNTGCGVNVGLVAGLCAGLGSAVIGLAIGAGLARYLKQKSNNWPIQPDTHHRPPRMSDNYRATQTQRPDRISLHTLGRGTNDRHDVNHSCPSEPSEEPPSYASLTNGSVNADASVQENRALSQPEALSSEHDIRPSVQISSSSVSYNVPSVNDNRPSARYTGDIDNGVHYEPPPPDYNVAIMYRDIYQVTESQPTNV